MKHIKPKDYADMMDILNEIHLSLKNDSQEEFQESIQIHLEAIEECISIIETFTTE